MSINTCNSSLPRLKVFQEAITVSYEFLKMTFHDRLQLKNFRSIERNLGPVYTIPFSFHIGLGKEIRYENFSCLHDAVSFHIGLVSYPLSERFHLKKTRKRYEACRIGTFSCKQEANPIWNENGIV